MNELLNNFINQIEDVNKVKEMSVEEFIKLVNSTKSISAEDAKQLIESFKKISSKKNTDDDGSDDSDQRRKKYKVQDKEINAQDVTNDKVKEEIQKEDDSLER